MGHRQMDWPGANRFMKLFNKKSSRNDNQSVRHGGTKNRLVGGSLKTIVRLNTPPGSPKLRHTQSHDSLLVSQININQDKTCFNSDVSNSKEQQHYSQMPSKCGSTAYFCCKIPEQQKRCSSNLKITRDANHNCLTRVDNSFTIFIMEAKGVPIKKRYFCELLFDGSHHAQTSSKSSSEQLCCFWGENFQFQDLPPVDTITINLYREEDKKKAKVSLIGSVYIHSSCVTSQSYIEKWFPLDYQNNKNAPKSNTSIRIKCKFQKIEIFPIELYNDLLQHIKKNYGSLCHILEPIISVKTKEDIATCLVNILQKEGIAKKFLSDLLMQEFKKNDDANLLLRGNSLASKAMEAFMKLVAEDYLQETLREPIRTIIESNIDCEVDPIRTSDISSIQHQQRNLLSSVKTIWSCILKSHTSFPTELRSCFQLFADTMKNSGNSHLTEKVISSSIFLRFLCPAVLSPSLFNIIKEYPNEKTSRNLTLIAKTLLTLANYTKFQDKEHYMEFMNEFIEEERENIIKFLKQISSPLPEDYNFGEKALFHNIDVEKQLSILETLLNETLFNGPTLYNNLSKNRKTIHLLKILQELNYRKSLDNNNHISSKITNQNPPILINSSDMNSSLEYITDVDVKNRNISNLHLEEKIVYADEEGEAIIIDESSKINTPSITVHPPEILDRATNTTPLIAMKPSISPSKEYLTGSRKPADNLKTSDDYVLLSALGQEQPSYQIPLTQSSSLSHLPTTPTYSKSIYIMSGYANHHHHFKNHLSRYRRRRQSLNDYLQYSKYNNILNTLEESSNMSSSKESCNTIDSHENSMTNQRLQANSSYNELGSEKKMTRDVYRVASNNKIIKDKKMNNNMTTIPLSIQNTLYELKPKNTNYFHNSIAPINLAHSVETLHISTQKDSISNSSSSFRHIELQNSKRIDSSTKNIPRTNPHYSPPNRITPTVSKPNYHQSLSDLDGNQYLRPVASSSKSIKKSQEEIQFLKAELDKMHQKLASVEERMFQVDISVTPKSSIGDQHLGRHYDRC